MQQEISRSLSEQSEPRNARCTKSQGSDATKVDDQNDMLNTLMTMVDAPQSHNENDINPTDLFIDTPQPVDLNSHTTSGAPSFPSRSDQTYHYIQSVLGASSLPTIPTASYPFNPTFSVSAPILKQAPPMYYAPDTVPNIQLPITKEKRYKCSLCKTIGHNRRKCPHLKSLNPYKTYQSTPTLSYASQPQRGVCEGSDFHAAMQNATQQKQEREKQLADATVPADLIAAERNLKQAEYVWQNTRLACETYVKAVNQLEQARDPS